MKGWSAVEAAGHDLRHAWRGVLGMPIVATVVVVSLAAGIGINTVVFSWVQARLLEPVPGVAGSSRLLLVEPRTDEGAYTGTSWLEYRDLRERLGAFRELLAFRMVPLYAGETGRTERIYGLLVSGNYFPALELGAVAGRLLTPADVGHPGGSPVAVISYGLWQRRFAGAAAAIGRPLRINGQHVTIVGVTPPEFQGTVFGLDFDAWLPATLAPTLLNEARDLEDRRSRAYAVMGLLQPAVGRGQAQRELDTAMRELARTFPETNTALGAEILAQSQAPRGPQRLLTAALLVLQAIMLLLLLAVCGNTATLVLARASARQREVGVRLALGAAPRRIVTLLLTETLLLGLAGALIGAAIAVWGTRALRVVPLTGLPIRFQTRVDLTGLGFAVLLGLGCGVAVGAAAAAQLSRVDPQRALRAGRHGNVRSGLRSTLLGVQVTLALVVLIVAGSFLRSFLDTRTADPGFRRDGVLLAAYDFTGRAVDAARARLFAEALLRRLRALPSVEAAAIATSVPLDIHGLPLRTIEVEGRARSDGGRDRALSNTVTPDYFALMGIPFLSGQRFAGLTETAVEPQAIVNDAFVARFLDGAEPIGRRVTLRGRSYAIVGVVRSSLYNAFGEAPTPALYLSYRDTPSPAGEIHLRTKPGAERRLAADIRRVVGELDPELPVFNVRTLHEHVDTNLIFRRVPARMFVVLGPLLLALAAIGIYAVVDYTSTLRTTEIGVRLALGATVTRLTAQLMGETLVVVAAGTIVGWLIAFILASGFALGRIVDVPVFFGVPVLLLAVASLASWLPVRRATRIEPAAALRQD